MPIRVAHRWLYPMDWRELSAAIRIRHVGGQCDGCGRPHSRMVVHLGDGRWWDAGAETWRCGTGRRVRLRALAVCEGISLPSFTTRVVPAAAHLDHDSANNDAANLATFCQRCHTPNSPRQAGAPQAPAVDLSHAAGARRPV